MTDQPAVPDTRCGEVNWVAGSCPGCTKCDPDNYAVPDAHSGNSEGEWWPDSYCQKHAGFHLQNADGGTGISFHDYADAERACEALNTQAAALQEARDRIDQLEFALGAAGLDIRGWFDRAEQHAERANTTAAALREATAEVDRRDALLLRWINASDRKVAWAMRQSAVALMVEGGLMFTDTLAVTNDGYALLNRDPAAPPAQEEGRA